MRSIKKTRKNRFWVWATLLFLLVALLLTLNAVHNIQTYGSIAAVRPPCSSHNDCPGHWMYCSGGECYSYTMGGGVGSGCSTNNDCKNLMLNCVAGRCQRVVGEPGGCSRAQECLDQFANTDPGFWSCTNGQCIKFNPSFRPGGTGQYYGSDGQWHNYGSSTACLLNSECESGSTCDEYGCVWHTNRDKCRMTNECGALPSNPNNIYMCVDASGNQVGEIYSDVVSSETGTCVEVDACDDERLLWQVAGTVDGRGCGAGTHCEVRTSWGGTMGNDRQGFCVSDDGTTASAGQTPQGWTTISCPGGTIIERCSNTAQNQRVRYCSNDPNYATNAIRWNGWVGSSDQTCVSTGELWGAAPQDPGNIPPKPSNVPAGFYDTTGCALGTRVERCSNTYPGQRVSYCTEDEANPVESVVRADNWVGPNGETCGLTGQIVANASAGSSATTAPRKRSRNLLEYLQSTSTNTSANVNTNQNVGNMINLFLNRFK